MANIAKTRDAVFKPSRIRQVRHPPRRISLMCTVNLEVLELVTSSCGPNGFVRLSIFCTKSKEIRFSRNPPYQMVDNIITCASHNRKTLAGKFRGDRSLSRHRRPTAHLGSDRVCNLKKNSPPPPSTTYGSCSCGPSPDHVGRRDSFANDQRTHRRACCILAGALQRNHSRQRLGEDIGGRARG